MNDDPKLIFDKLVSAGLITNSNFDAFVKKLNSDADYNSKVMSAYSGMVETEPVKTTTDPVKKKEQSSVSSSASLVQPSESPSPEVDGQGVYGKTIELEEAPVYPEPDFWDNMYNSSLMGANRLNKALADIPRTLYSVASIPQNMAADLLNLPQLSTDYDAFLSSLPEDSFLHALNAISKGVNEDFVRLQKNKEERYGNIIYTFEKEGFGEAFEQAAEMTLESFPITLAGVATTIMAGPSAGASVMGGLSFPSYQEEFDKFEELEPWQRDGLATVLSALEFVFEKPVNEIISRQAKEIIKEQGEDAAREFVYNSAFKYAIKPLSMVGGNTLRGGVSEWATQYSQNVVRAISVNPEQDLFEGAADAFIVGMLSDNMISAPIYVASSYGQVKNYKKDRAVKKVIESIDREISTAEDMPDIIRRQLEQTKQDMISAYNNNLSESIRFYDSMSLDDRQQVYQLTKSLIRLGKLLSDSSISELQKEAATSLFSTLAEQKAAIELRYDSENIKGISGDVGVGETVIEGQPIKEGSKEETETDRVLQGAEVEPTWFGKPMSEVVNSTIPEEITAEEVQAFFEELKNQAAQESMGKLEVDFSDISIEDMQKVYSVARKALMGETVFSEDEMNIFAENQEVIADIMEAMKVAKESTEKKITENHTVRKIAQKVLAGETEFTDIELDTYAKRGEDVDALVGDSRRAENRAASMLPQILRDIRQKTRPKMVAMTDKAIVRQRIKDMIDGAKGALNAQQDVQNELKVMIDELAKTGLITMRQAASLAKAALSVNVKNKRSADSFANKYEAIVHKAGRRQDIKKAKDLRSKIRSESRKKYVPVNIRVALKAFSRVNPETVDDIVIYNDMARSILNVAKTQNVDKTSLERILPYIEGQAELTRAIGRDVITESYSEQQRLRGYLNEVIDMYVQEQIEQARDMRLDKIAEESGVSREELDSAIEETGQDEIIAGYYGEDGQPIMMPDGSRRTLGKDIMEKMRNSLEKKGYDLSDMSDSEVSELFLNVINEKNNDAAEKGRALVRHKLSTIKYDGLSEVVSSAESTTTDNLTLKELNKLNNILDNIIINGSEANAGIAKLLLEKSERVETITDIVSKKKIGRFSEKFLGTAQAKSSYSTFFRFDQIVSQILGRSSIGSILDKLGYDNYRVAEATSNKILYSERVALRETISEINKKYGIDVNSLDNQTKASIYQIILQSRNSMTKVNEDVIVNSIIANLENTALKYESSANKDDLTIAKTIRDFLDLVGKPKYEDYVEGFAMHDKLLLAARNFAGQGVVSYAEAWANTHEKYKPLYADYLLKFRNEILAEENNYTAIGITKIGSVNDGIFESFDPTEGTGTTLSDYARVTAYFDRMISTPKSPNFIKRNPATYKLKVGEGYNMRFTNVQDRAIGKSVREAVVSPSVMAMSSMFAKNGVGSLFNNVPADTHNEQVLKNTLASEIAADAVLRTAADASDIQVIRTAKNIAAPAVFGSFGSQFIKQASAPIVSAMFRTTMYNKSAWNSIPKSLKFAYDARSNEESARVIQELINLSDVKERDLTTIIVDPLQQFSVLGSSINSGKAMPIVNAAVGGLRDALLYPLRSGDKITAIASYLAFLNEGYMSKYGREYSFDEMLKNPDKELIARASYELRDSQNTNSPKSMAPILRDASNAGSFVASSLLSFSSFAINFKTGIYNDVSNIAEAKDSESRSKAAASLASRLVEASTYQAMAVYGLPIIASSLASVLYGELGDEYEEGMDEFLQDEKALTKFLSNFVEDVLPTVTNIPGLSYLAMVSDDLLILGVNYFYYNLEESITERGLSYDDYKKIGLLPLRSRLETSDVTDMAGKYGVAVKIATDAAEAIHSSLTGKHTDDYGNVTYYDESQREALMKIGLYFSFAAMGLSSEELRGASYYALNEIREGDYSSEVERLLQSSSTEDYPIDFMKEAGEEITQEKEQRLESMSEKAIVSSAISYSELNKKIFSFREPKAAGVFLYERVKGEADDDANRIIGEFLYYGAFLHGEQKTVSILEQYIREKNRAERLGYSSEQIIDNIDLLFNNIESAKPQIDKLDDPKLNKKIEERLNGMLEWVESEIEKQK